MAPECLIESVKEPPSDIWGLGCVVCEMLTGKSPQDRVRVGQIGSVRIIADEHELPQVGA